MNHRPRQPADTSWLAALLRAHFGSTTLVSRGVLHDSLALPGLVAEEVSRPVGVLLYRMARGECEVVALISLRRRVGIGRLLMAAAEKLAREAGCTRLWVVTTNNNRAALAFYRALGMRLVAVHPGAVRQARRLKPEIPEVDADGTPIEDEIEFELPLGGSRKLA